MQNFQYHKASVEPSTTGLRARAVPGFATKGGLADKLLE